MNRPVRLKDIMQVNPICVYANDEIAAALQTLLDNNISGAPVLNDQKVLVGVLSQKDCIRAALDAHYHHSWGDRGERYMTESVETLGPEMELVNAAHFFTHSQYRRFPIVDNKQLVGQISRTDVLQAICKFWQ